MIVAEETCDCLLPSSTTPWGTIISVAVFVAVVLIGAAIAWRRSLNRVGPSDVDAGAGGAEGEVGTGDGALTGDASDAGSGAVDESDTAGSGIGDR